jgi:hypothetical protein
MGSCYSFFLSCCEGEQRPVQSLSGLYWKVIPTMSQAQHGYLTDGTLPSDCSSSQLELRTLLDYNIAQQCISDFINISAPAMKTNFKGWLDMQHYRQIADGTNMKLNMAQSIYHKYVNANPSIQLELRDEVRETLVTCQDPCNVFDAVQKCFFITLHDEVFLSFKASAGYKQMSSALRQKYNRVGVSDFYYYDVLGTGGYGIVVKVTKKSTCKCVQCR